MGRNGEGVQVRVIPPGPVILEPEYRRMGANLEREHRMAIQEARDERQALLEYGVQILESEEG